MVKWSEYQEDAARLFRSLGLDATTNERVAGARGAHDVDVVVRSQRAGLEQLWIVECKSLRRRVEKLHVAALAEIVRDVGADRGVLLSEVGFQSGAFQMAVKSNVTLTSLADLREEAEAEFLMLRLSACRLELIRLHQRLRRVGRVRRGTPNQASVSYQLVPERWTPIQLYAAVGVAEDGLRLAEIGSWPAPYAWNFETDRARRAFNLGSFIDGLTETLSEIEAQLSALEAANSRYS